MGIHWKIHFFFWRGGAGGAGDLTGPQFLVASCLESGWWLFPGGGGGGGGGGVLKKKKK